MEEKAMMQRQPKPIQFPWVGTILLSVLVGVLLVALKRFAKSDPSSAVIRHSVDTHSDDALKYWTADKMRDTKNTTMPNLTAPDRGKKRSRRSSHTSDPERS
jgi:hypothetical protein